MWIGEGDHAKCKSEKCLHGGNIPPPPTNTQVAVRRGMTGGGRVFSGTEFAFRCDENENAVVIKRARCVYRLLGPAKGVSPTPLKFSRKQHLTAYRIPTFNIQHATRRHLSAYGHWHAYCGTRYAEQPQPWRPARVCPEECWDGSNRDTNRDTVSY